jgi:hypothetical protein
LNKIKNVPLVIRIPESLYNLIDYLAGMNKLTPGRYVSNIIINFFNGKIDQLSKENVRE